MNNAKRYTFQKSRSGETVPLLDTQPLHSMIDPKREAERLVSTAADMGFLVFLGLGGGFAPQAALELTNAQITVIDFDKNSITELLTGMDYSALLNNERFKLIVDPSDEEIKNFILENYKPVICGGIKTIPLRTRTEQDKPKFERAAAVLQEAIENVCGDYSVQSHFGIRWFSNIIRNIKTMPSYNDETCYDNILTQKNIVRAATAAQAAIVAAGPSLDRQLSSLAELKAQGAFVISADTALNVLQHNGIQPDAVVSIDCQHISYYHFMTNCKTHSSAGNIPLILDIASPPMLCGFSSLSPVFFSSGHPLALYINAHFRPLPVLDTSGGNVTYACLSLAEFLGAQSITLFGADFSYVNSQSYARGTYIYPYFYKRQNRLSSLEAQLSAFLYRSPFLPCEDGKKKNYYETSSLRFYRKKLEEKASLMCAQIICAKGDGAPVNLYKEQRTVNQEYRTEINGQKANISGADFLENYRNDTLALPQTNDAKKLNAKQQQVFTTLLPLAAAIKKRNMDLKFNDLMEETKRRCATEIDKIL